MTGAGSPGRRLRRGPAASAVAVAVAVAGRPVVAVAVAGCPVVAVAGGHG
ncbi:hypothetical protein [Kitasatospora sp. MMS16-BH015]|nr:hypothetical protein [Kitasatospora sp. MMS16-BH015]